MEDVCKILIVEDDELIAMDMERMIEKMGHEVIEVLDNSEDVLEFLEEETIDLAILDIRIQGQYDGIELADKIQMIHEDLAILFVTSMQDDLTFNRASRSQPDGFIVKPFSEIQFQRSLELIIRKIQTRPKDETRDPNTDIQIRDDAFFIRKRHLIKKVPFKDIHYLEADGGKYCKLFVDQDVFIVRYSLKTLLEKIRNEHFYQCHRSYVVNMSKISSVDLDQNLIYVHSRKVPISRREKTDLIKRLDYL